MPIYVYECSDCLETWKESHSMEESIDCCVVCDSKEVYRKPTIFSNVSKRAPKKQKVGSKVKEFIESSKKELDLQKKGMRNND